MSLFTVANDVCDIIGIERQVAIAAGTGGDARQLYRLCKLELSELARRTSWQALAVSHAFTSLATIDQGATSVPDDFLFMIPETFFNRTSDYEVFGPVSARESALLEMNPAGTGWQQVYRIKGNVVGLYPGPVTAGESYVYEYISNLLATGSDLTTEKVTYLLDADVARLDEELIKLGVVWRWKNLKGLDYAEDFRTYEMQVANSIARDGGKRTISMDGTRPPGAPMIGIPAGNWTP